MSRAPRLPAPVPGSPRSAEERLLLSCARLTLTPARAADARKLAATADWELLLALGERHRLIPFLHRHLKDAPLPAWAAAELRARHRHGVGTVLSLSAELRRLVDLLAAGGVDALAYKGPALALQAYGDLSLRTFTDLDLAVRPADVPRALRVLAGDGYTPALGMSRAQERFFRRVDGDYPLVHEKTGVLVELHARVSSRRFGVPLETDELMRSAEEVALGGTTVRAVGGRDLLTVLCVHGAKHRWKRLEWLVAVAELLRARGGDAGALVSHAARRHARRTVLVALSLANRLLDAPVPDDAVRAMAGDNTVRMLADEAEARIFGAEPDGGDEAPANLRFNLRAREGAVDRARFAWAWLFAPTPEDWGWARLPDPLFSLYRVTRPVRLVLRHRRSGDRG